MHATRFKPVNLNLTLALAILCPLPTGCTCSDYFLRPLFTRQSWQLFTERAIDSSENSTRTRRLVVCFDSLSSVISLGDVYYPKLPSKWYFCAISCLIHQDVQLTIVWIPWHVGICGNELAANAALELSLCTGWVPPINLKRSIREARVGKRSST